jgi:mono/diheme cytochrome c family protein
MCRTAAFAGGLLVAATALLAAQGGPYERQKIDAAAASRGRALYARHCINCHGSSAKGTDRGPDLIRSVLVLHDRLGDGIGPAIKPSATHQSTLTAAEIVDLSHFLHQRIETTASNRSPRGPINVLTGDPEAGRTYFNGAGRCSTCHSATGDLAGVATRIADPVSLQQRFLFPVIRRDAPRQIVVTVTPAGGTTVAGTLVRMDDFFVSLRDASGEYHAFDRGPGVAVSVDDPLAAHHELLDRYTDADMHNVTAYLSTLK